MMTTLPPTINSLDPIQRSRLLKSTRKLGDVLGAVPLVVDADSPHSAASSVTSLHAVYIPLPRSSEETRYISPVHKKQKSKQLNRPLLLRLQTVPLPPAEAHPKSLSVTDLMSTISLDGTASLSADGANLTVAGMSPPSPLPEPDILDPDRQRRRRMAKLTHTLGESIPAELVFPQHHGQAFIMGQNKKYEKAKVSKHRPQISVPNMSTPNIVPPPVPSNWRMHRARSITISSSSAAVRMFKVLTMSSARGKSLDEAPFVQDPIAAPDKNKQKGWSGEWSVKDAEKRAMALRNLKSR